MRLDHLLSREYEKGNTQWETRPIAGKRLRIGLGVKDLYCIVLKVRGALSEGQKDEGRDHRGGVAQLGEHLLCKQGVIGSNPFISTSFFRKRRKRGKKRMSKAGIEGMGS